MKYLILILLLVGCAPLEETKPSSMVTAKDGYRFLVKDGENLSPRVEFILLRNEDEREIVLKKFFGNEWKKIAGFTFWNPEKSTCRIVVPDPEWKYVPEIIGHEVAHCIWGKFHKGDEGLGGIIEN